MALIIFCHLGSGIVDSEENGACEADGGEEGVGAAVIAHGNAALGSGPIKSDLAL